MVLQRLFPGAAIRPVNESKETESMPADSVVEWSSPLKEQGIEEGRRLGLEQGRTEGEMTVLERLLTRCFGSLPEAVQVRPHAASTEQRENRAGQIPEAGSREEVFSETDYHASSADRRIGPVSRAALGGGQPLGEGFPPLGRREGSPPTRDGDAVRERCARADSLRSLRDHPDPY